MSNQSPEGLAELISRVEYCLDPSTSAKERLGRRAHLTGHDLRTILAALRTTQCSGDTQELADELERLFEGDDAAKSIDEVEEAHGALFRWFYPNRVAILTALRTTHSPSEAVEVTWEVWEDDLCVASSTDEADARHYLAVYSQDAPVRLVRAETRRFDPALSLPSDKTVGLLREALEAALDEREQERGRLPDGSPHWSVRARELLAKLDSHLGEMK